jgi:hypothetical protein
MSREERGELSEQRDGLVWVCVLSSGEMTPTSVWMDDGSILHHLKLVSSRLNLGHNCPWKHVLPSETKLRCSRGGAYFGGNATAGSPVFSLCLSIVLQAMGCGVLHARYASIGGHGICLLVFVFE